MRRRTRLIINSFTIGMIIGICTTICSLALEYQIISNLIENQPQKEIIIYENSRTILE